MAAAEGVVIACHTREEFDRHMEQAKESHKLVIVDFTASWCGPCRVMAPIFTDYAKKFAGAVFLKVDVDELKDVTEKYEVEAMPTFMLFKDGEKIDAVVGAMKEELHAKIENHICAPAA